MGRQPKSYVDEKGRVCLTCAEYKLWDHYHAHPRGTHGRQAHCKVCVSDIYTNNLMPLPPCYWCKLVIENRYVWGRTADGSPLCGCDCDVAYKRHVEILKELQLEMRGDVG